MAKNKETEAAAKAKKQKVILIVGSVALLAVAGLQVPKLMKGSSQPAAAPVAATPDATPVGASAPVPAAAAVVLKPAGTVAGVSLPGGTEVVVAKSQLASFTLFDAKDPFVPQEGAESATGATTEPAATATSAPVPAATGGGATPAPKPPAPNHATIKVNGKAQEVAVKGTFPSSDPTFVLLAVKNKTAKVGVAGGSFDDSQNVTLTVGKKVTLVNTATSVRYELLLVRTENAASFTATPDSAPGGSASSTTPTVTTNPSTSTTTATATP